jgi:hypothetical protein
MMRVASVCVVLMAAGCAGTRESGPAQIAAPVDDGVTEFGKQVPRLVERYLDEAGEGGENGWRHLQELNDFLWDEIPWRPGDDAALYPDFELVMWHTPEQAELRALAVKWLDELEAQGLDARLAVVAGARRIVPPAKEGPLLDWIWPEIGYGRAGVRLCVGRMALAAERGDEVLSVRSLDQGLAMARAVECVPWVHGRLSACAMRLMMLQGANELMLGRTFAPATLREMAAAIERQRTVLPLAMPLEGTRLIARDAARQVYQDAERPPRIMLMELLRTTRPDAQDRDDERQAADELIETYGVASEAESIACIEEGFAELTRIFAGPSSELRERVLGFVTELIEGRDRRTLILELMVRWAFRLDRQHVLTAALMAGTRVNIAIQLWRAEKGEYPESLDELVPVYLPELPVDPFTGRSMGYRRTEAWEEDDRGYVLYCTGRDGMTNGGRRNDPGTLSEREARGRDVIINSRRGQ